MSCPTCGCKEVVSDWNRAGFYVCYLCGNPDCREFLYEKSQQQLFEEHLAKEEGWRNEAREKFNHKKFYSIQEIMDFGYNLVCKELGHHSITLSRCGLYPKHPEEYFEPQDYNNAFAKKYWSKTRFSEDRCQTTRTTQYEMAFSSSRLSIHIKPVSKDRYKPTYYEVERYEVSYR